MSSDMAEIMHPDWSPEQPAGWRRRHGEAGTYALAEELRGLPWSASGR